MSWDEFKRARRREKLVSLLKLLAFLAVLAVLTVLGVMGPTWYALLKLVATITLGLFVLACILWQNDVSRHGS